MEIISAENKTKIISEILAKMMEIKTVTQRKFRKLINSSDENLATGLLSEYGVTENIVDVQRFEQVMTSFGKNITISSFRKLWNKVELFQFFNSWVSIYKAKPQKITFTNFKKLFKGLDLKPSSFFYLNLSPNRARHKYQFTMLSSPVKGMVDRAGSGENNRDSLYWLPEEGLVFLKVHKDQNGEKLKNYIENNVTGKLEQFRVRSMVISKFYKQLKIIRQLSVSAIFEGI